MSHIFSLILNAMTIVKLLFPDNNRRAFLRLSGFYVEPMPTVSQMRLFLFVGSRISSFDILPAYRQHEPVPGSLLTTPRFIDLNM